LKEEDGISAACTCGIRIKVCSLSRGGGREVNLKRRTVISISKGSRKQEKGRGAKEELT